VFPPDVPAVPGLFDELNKPSTEGEFGRWQTVGSVRDTRAPVAIGLGAGHVTTGTAIIGLVETSFFTLEVLDLPFVLDPGAPHRPSPPQVHQFATVPAALPDWDKLDPAIPLLHTPARGPMLRTQRGRLFIRLPIDVPLRADADPCGSEGADPGETVPPYEQTAFSDKTPMVVLKPPTGNFAFGSSVRAVRSLYQRSSGGALNSIICGHERSIPAAELVMTDAMRATRRRPRLQDRLLRRRQTTGRHHHPAARTHRQRPPLHGHRLPHRHPRAARTLKPTHVAPVSQMYNASSIGRLPANVRAYRMSAAFGALYVPSGSCLSSRAC
jgi:hypothetical protein